MESSKQDRIIQLALQKGLLSDIDIELLEGDRQTLSRRSGKSRLDRLTQAGLISDVMISSLEREVDTLDQISQSGELFESQLLAHATASAKNRFINNRDSQKKATPNTPNSSSQNSTPTIASQGSNSSQSSGEVDALATMVSGTSLPTQRRRLQAQKLGRYQLIRLLGEGGMGSVYQAYDPALKRSVALKFLHGSDQESIKRLLMEGRAQARIEHPNVCRVYEVDRIDDQIYIAMQYIDGKTLINAMSEMTIEQKVKTIAEVADGLHAAHKEGLIHRDIKPHNIMVEKSPDGVWKAYVMDFGLVREISRKGITMTGEVLGTPCYMAPEQARGKTELLDRRTDVYSLGATLYELLCGKPPFEGNDIMALLLQVMNEDVKPLRQRVPQLPLDLETIAMKCLEKEPQQRYDSAKSLQEDLLRYLADEPIKGQRANWRYRIVKHARKNRALFAMITVALLSVAIATGAILRARWQYAQRTRLSQQFGDQVKEIENIMRYGHMMPLHDISREEGLVGDHMRVVADTIGGLGETGEGPGQYALGRAYEVLGDYDNARKHLEIAWHKGYQEPQAAYALGLVFGKLYQRRITELEQQMDNRELRELDRGQAEMELKSPALYYLAQGRNSVGESSEYVEALIAYYDRHWQDALQKANIAIVKAPWLYEAKRLIGDTYVAIGSELQEKQDIAGAEKSFQTARVAYQEAIATGGSDVANYESLSAVWMREMALNFYQGDGMSVAFQQVLQAAEQGQQADRKWIDGYGRRALAHLLYGQYLSIRLGTDPLDEYDKAIDQAQHAIKINSDYITAYNTLGTAYLVKGKYFLTRGEDPLSSLDNSIASFQSVLQINSNQLNALINIGNAYLIKVQYIGGQGGNPVEELAHIKENCEKALAINNQIHFVYSTLGLASTNRAQLQLSRGEDPSAELDEAIANFRKALELRPNNMMVFFYLGNVYLEKGRYQVNRGQSPTVFYDQALNNFRSAMLINDKFPTTYNNIGYAYWLKGSDQLQHGEDPNLAFDQAIASCRQALEINPTIGTAFSTISASYWLKSDYLLKRGENPLPLVDQAVDYYHKAIEINDKDAINYFNYGAVNYVAAKYHLRRNEDIDKNLLEAIRALNHAETINPILLTAFQYEARISLLQVDQAIAKRQNPEFALQNAEIALKKLQKLTANDPDTLQIQSEWYRRKAELLFRKGQQPKTELTEGLTCAERAIAFKPDLAEAYLSKGALQLLTAKSNQDTNQRRQIGKDARVSLEKALSINNFLDRDCRTMLDEARKLEAGS